MLSENAITGYCFIKLSEYRFNAWSLSCNCTGRSYGNVPADFFVFRGYTGHEHIDVFNLINMNGRVYDPLLGIFLSPDNYVQMPDATQGFNRYAYCFNNPLKYTDPSGEIVIQLLGLAISYIIQQLHPQSLNSYIPNYYQNRSSLIGFGVGALVNCFIPGANGLIKGAILGGLSGGLSGGLTAGIDALLSGGNFGDAFSKGFSSGLLSGMITGGIKGGLTARQYGLNILTGEPRNNMNDLIVMASLQQPEASSGVEWYYGVDVGGFGHSIAWNSTTNTVYEINHPFNGKIHGVVSRYYYHGPKTQGYKYDLDYKIDRDKFWGFRGGRESIELYPVNVTNSQAATAFFESHIGPDSWDYNFFTNNCKHYVIQGFEAGGALITNKTCVPTEWPGQPTIIWTHP